ncbi:MAG: hypothetical protein NT075_05810 [Chloroflexi bacterium]|nr:hypothetical protein [Chloroflexota bacterium]
MTKATTLRSRWHKISKQRAWWLLLATGVALCCLTGRAVAADIRGGDDVFRLGPDEVVNDDLYVAAREIYIDGTVNGDLIAVGGYIEVNGVVTGDAMLAGGGVNLNGVVQDDARIAGGGVVVSGQIGDDLVVAGGGSTFTGVPSFPIRIGQHTIAQGVQLTGNATVGGDAYLVGGQGDIAGSVKNDLFAAMGAIIFGGKIDGNAELKGQDITIRNTGKVGGVLRYDSRDPVTVPPEVAQNVQAVTPPTPPKAPPAPPLPIWPLLTWLWRTLLILIGLALLAWIWVRVAPNLLRSTTSAIETKPVEAGLYGVLAAALIVPIIAALVILTMLFGGVFPGILVLFFLFSGILLLWFFSPLLTGLWLGRKLVANAGSYSSRLSGTLATLLTGALAIVLVARLIGTIPFVGLLVAALIYLLSFALALGGMIVSRRQPRIEQE